MKPTLLVNQTGGHKHAYHPDELAADLEHGWALVDARAGDVCTVEGVCEPGGALLVMPVKRKPGRPRKDAK